MIYNILNTFVNITNENEYIKYIFNTLNNKQKKVFFYFNTFSFYLINYNIKFNKAFSKANYVIPDGYSAVFAIRIIYNKKIEKVVFTYTFTNKLAKLFEENKIKIFCLGGTKGSITKFYNKIKNDYPNLIISDFNDGYFDIERETDYIIDKINNSNADVLIVGMGMPKSEIWIMENLDKINVNCIFSVGGFFEFIAGNKKQAPSIFYNSGFEWTYRLIQEPLRLTGRYFKSHLYFIYRLTKFLLIKK